MRKSVFIEKKCLVCSKNFFTTVKYKKYCSQDCCDSAQINKAELSNPYGISTSRLGSIAELSVAVLLETHGYDVYRAISFSSKFDMVAVNEDNTFFIEARTGRYNFDKSKVAFPQNTHSEKVNLFAVFTYEDSKVRFYNRNGKINNKVLNKSIGKPKSILKVELA